MVAGLAWSWWPRPGQYAPIEPWERGTLADAVAVARPAPQFGVGTQGTATVAWPKGKPRPTRDHPQLALVLIPRPGSSTSSSTSGGLSGTDTGSGTSTQASTDPSTWVFPVNLPLATGPGDNHAVAVNTTNNSVVYDTAFAMVWDTGGGTADNTNQAYALANCTNCAAVSVAFQVVFVVGQTSAAVPQNVSVAVNSGCTGCLTFALAVQLFVTLDGPLDQQQMQALSDLWHQIQDYGRHIADVPLSDIQAQLDAYEQQILDIVDPGGTGTATSSPTVSTSASVSSTGPATSSTTSTGTSSPGATQPAAPGSSGPASASNPSGAPSGSTSPTDAPTSASPPSSAASTAPSSTAPSG
jgi:putative peptide zinc metalloprotease protein